MYSLLLDVILSQSFSDLSQSDCLQAFYVVHPTTLLKYWIFMLRLAMPEIYGRVTYINRLADLQQKMVLDSLDIPQHVQDYDASLQ